MLHEDNRTVLDSVFECEESADELSNSPRDIRDGFFSMTRSNSLEFHSRHDINWILKEANWIAYRREMDHIISGWSKVESDFVSIEEQNERLSNAIMTSALKAIPQHNSHANRLVDKEAAERVELFMDAFVEMSSCEVDRERMEHHVEMKQYVMKQLETKCSCQKCELFTLEQLRAVLHAARKRKNSGPDGICYDLLRELSLSGEIAFLHLINCTWRDGATPSSWRESAIHLTIRRGHPVELLSSYRVVGVSNCMSKCAERLFILRLRPFLVNCGVLQTNISRICTNSLCDSYNKMLHVAAVDIYDVLERMIHFRFPLCWVRWSTAMLCDRRASLHLANEVSSSKALCFGLPIGSLLSPLFWTLYSYPVSRQLIDRALSLPTGSVEDVTCRMERALSLPMSFCDESYLVGRFLSLNSVDNDNGFCNLQHQFHADEYLQDIAE